MGSVQRRATCWLVTPDRSPIVTGGLAGCILNDWETSCDSVESKPQNSRVQNSLALYKRAAAMIPGGTQLLSRQPSRFAYGVSPIYAARARGARFWDVDGHEYIDWTSGIGAILLGYADAVVDDAVREQISQGTIYGINHELELELAEELIERVPCAEMVRYAKTGGEACAMAVRIARAATGRDTILFCGYHGWHDWYLAANLNDETELEAHLLPDIAPRGVPRALAGTSIPFPYGDADALGESLDVRRGKVAAVVMEPLRSDEPPKGYLAAVATLCRDHGAVLVFDEVSTGFRYSTGGAQSDVGVTPDVAVFAKSISNGYPLAAVVGRRDVMQAAAETFVSSTYWSDTVGLRAGLTTLREAVRRDVPGHCRQVGSQLQTELTRLARQKGCPVRCCGIATHPRLEFDVSDAGSRTVLETLYIQEMARRGCHGLTAFYLNAAQGERELEQTLGAAGETFALLSDAHASGEPQRWLECPVREVAFRRLVH